MKIVVVGAGASGIMAAIMAASNGAEVLVIEQAEKPGKKIYATGNGRCNLTNKDMKLSYFRGHHLECAEYALDVMGTKETMNFFEKIGLRFQEKNGYIYPASGQAASVVMVLTAKCKELGVEFLCNTMVKQIDSKQKGFTIICTERIKKEKKQICERDLQIKADKVILATGTRAGGFGCEVTGIDIAKSFGHHIYPVVPALTGLKCQETKFFKQTAGVRCQGRLRLYLGNSAAKNFLTDENLLGEDCGEIQLTDYGISGIVAFQLARFASYELLFGKKVFAEIDFLTEFSESQLYVIVKDIIENNPTKSIGEAFCGIYHSKLAEGLLKYMGIDFDMPAIKLLKTKKVKDICNTFKHFVVEVKAVNDIKNAQVCAGGVDMREITKDFMSKKKENLYITGEMLDVDGICGGYNLQFAWSSGYLAGLAAGKA